MVGKDETLKGGRGKEGKLVGKDETLKGKKRKGNKRKGKVKQNGRKGWNFEG